MSEPRQLIMRRGLDDLPPRPGLPAGYEMRTLRPAEEQALVDLLTASFPEVAWTMDKARQTLLESPLVEAIYVIGRGDDLVQHVNLFHHRHADRIEEIKLLVRRDLEENVGLLRYSGKNHKRGNCKRRRVLEPG